jgi:hypothetical protein
MTYRQDGNSASAKATQEKFIIITLGRRKEANGIIQAVTEDRP